MPVGPYILWPEKVIASHPRPARRPVQDRLGGSSMVVMPRARLADRGHTFTVPSALLVRVIAASSSGCSCARRCVVDGAVVDRHHVGTPIRSRSSCHGTMLRMLHAGEQDLVAFGQVGNPTSWRTG